MDVAAPPPDERAAELVRSACSSDLRTARTLLDAEPALARHDLATACVTGEVDVVRRLVERDPDVERRVGPSDWTPLLGSVHCHDAEAGPTMRTDDEVDHGDYPGVVRILLEAGAAIPQRLWDAAPSAEVLLARLGIAAV